MARELLYETVIEPGTGKALEVLRGQVLRIEQLEDGGQCADFNCFNLHDYKEHFHTARTFRPWQNRPHWPRSTLASAATLATR